MSYEPRVDIRISNFHAIARKLDIRGTKFPADLLGHWNALMLYYDVGNPPDYIHEAIYPQLCPKQV